MGRGVLCSRGAYRPCGTRLTLGAMDGALTLVFSGRFGPSGTSLTLGCDGWSADFGVLGARLTLGAMAGARTLVFSGRFGPSGTSLTLGGMVLVRIEKYAKEGLADARPSFLL
ncbi:hypothetical protein [Paenibacillus sp. FSL H7-0331]|uniref:hypothetical protein n=1 Tax=Paenibacillus sp. FSL H7-0331 TaxID=1920421 RepID=UPI0015C37652|nr:hypothetical protein [Paenibacillus sp. FSL H7-0331]